MELYGMMIIMKIYIPAVSYSANIEWADSAYGIVWVDRRDGNDEIYFTKLGSDGTKLLPDIRITNAGGYSRHPSFAWNGQEFGIIWWDNRDGNYGLYFTRIYPNGNKLENDRLITYVNAWVNYPFLIWDTTQFVASYHIQNDVNIALITNTNAAINNLFSGGHFPHIVWNGYEYGMSWINYDARNEIYFTRLDS